MGFVNKINILLLTKIRLKFRELQGFLLLKSISWLYDIY